MRPLIRYARLYRVFLENCFVREAEFRANFWANLFTNTGWLFFYVLFIKVIYLNTRRIGNWTEAEAMVLTGTFGVIQGLFNIIAYQNVSQLPDMIRLGTLDFVVTRPVNAYFMAATRYVKLDSLGNVAGAALVTAYGISLTHAVPPFSGVAAYLFLCLCALLIYFGSYMLLMTLAFWLVRVENLAVLTDTVFSVGRYPIDVFRGWGRTLFTYLIPVAFVASFPARALFGKAPASWLWAGAVIAGVLLWASVRFWSFGLRNYSSAGS